MSPPTRKIVFHVPSLLPDEGDKRAADAPPERGDSSLLAPTAPTEPSGDGGEIRKLATLLEISQALAGSLNLQTGL